jgi:hypothetical protein
LSANRLPESWTRLRVAGILGAVLGGTFAVVIQRTYWAIVIGCVVGAVVAIFVAHMARDRVGSRTLSTINRSSSLFFVSLGFAMTLAGVIGFIKTGRWIGLVGAAFFALGTLYLLRFGTRD